MRHVLVKGKRPEPRQTIIAPKIRERAYAAGRSTCGWDIGQRVNSSRDVAVGDVLIAINHASTNGSENLIQVTAIGELPRDCFEYCYVTPDYLTKHGHVMALWSRELHSDDADIYKAVDRRIFPGRIVPAELPAWLSMGATYATA